ncbi:MAG: undecaprenyl-diphosphate phosphatase, partial [Thermodesulfobacteriota bacterium]|nr:undecaprenyl-diphosphate phosphatase [Thermodesulfobacteriota bacterium]
IGIVFEDIFHVLFTNILCTSLMLIVTGGIILFASFKRSNHKTDNAITIKDALLIGTAQGIAIIPGISRSGATIATGIFLGIDGETAARFSFLTSIPAILGAVGMECFKIRFVPSSEILYYILGMVMAAAVGTVAIGFLVNVLRRLRLGIFAYYCFFVGGIFGFFNL